MSIKYEGSIGKFDYLIYSISNKKFSERLF